MKTRRDAAEELAYGLGITLYLGPDPPGRIECRPFEGAEMIEPRAGSGITPLGIPAPLKSAEAKTDG